MHDFSFAKTNNSTLPRLPTSSLPSEYSQKAVFLNNVISADSVYRPPSEPVTQSRVFQSESVDPEEVAVAFTRIGEGWLGYLGDVNNEQGSQRVIMSMLELATKHSTGV